MMAGATAARPRSRFRRGSPAQSLIAKEFVGKRINFVERRGAPAITRHIRTNPNGRYMFWHKQSRMLQSL